MKNYLGRVAAGILLFAGLQTSFGQLDGLDDRYRTEDTFRDPDNSPGEAFSPFQPTNQVSKKQISTQSVKVGAFKQGWVVTFMAQPKLGYESNPLHSQSTHGSMLYGVDEKSGLSYVSTNCIWGMSGYSLGIQQALGTSFYDDNQLPNGTSTSDADSIQNKVLLTGSVLITTNLLAALTGIGAHTIVNGRAANESAGVSPSAAFKWPVKDQWAASSLAYTYNRFNDLSPQTNPNLRDQANENTLTMNTSFFPNGPFACFSNIISSVTIGYAHKWHDSDGNLRQYQSDNASIELVGPFFPNTLHNTNILYDITYAHTWKDYAAPGTASVGVTRNDNSDDVLVQLDWNFWTHPVDPLLWQKHSLKLDWIISYEFTTNDSNKRTVAYSDHTVFTGLKFGF